MYVYCAHMCTSTVLGHIFCVHTITHHFSVCKNGIFFFHSFLNLPFLLICFFLLKQKFSDAEHNFANIFKSLLYESRDLIFFSTVFLKASRIHSHLLTKYLLNKKMKVRNLKMPYKFRHC